MLPDDEKPMKNFFEKFHGSYGLLILATLRTGPVYGPDLRSRLNQNFKTIPSYGSLYSALDKLEDMSLISRKQDREREGETCQITERGAQVVDVFYVAFKRCLGSSR